MRVEYFRLEIYDTSVFVSSRDNDRVVAMREACSKEKLHPNQIEKRKITVDGIEEVRYGFEVDGYHGKVTDVLTRWHQNFQQS